MAALRKSQQPRRRCNQKADGHPHRRGNGERKERPFGATRLLGDGHAGSGAGPVQEREEHRHKYPQQNDGQEDDRQQRGLSGSGIHPHEEHGDDADEEGKTAIASNKEDGDEPLTRRVDDRPPTTRITE